MSVEFPYGVLANSGAVLVGGLLGTLLKNAIPQRLILALPKTLGLAAIAIGISGILKIQAVPVVVLSLVIGSILGELWDIDRRLLGSMQKLKNHSLATKDQEQRELFISLLVLFCASGTGIFGAMQAGMSNDHSILLAKSVLDFFTAMSFATTLGFLISLLAIPQILVQLSLYFTSSLFLPYVSLSMLSNFQAVGGIITLAIGLKIANIKDIRAINLTPGLLLVFPLTFLWEMIW